MPSVGSGGKPKAASRRAHETKQRDAERTRQRLLDAGEHVFSKHGLDGASTEAIARRAGVSKTMLFYYYQSKEQLYVEVLKRLFESVVEPGRAAEIEKMEPKAALRAIVSEYFNIHLRRPTFAELTVREAMTYGGKHLPRLRYDLPFVGQLMRVLRRGALSGDFRSVDTLKTTVSMVGMTKILFTYRQAMERVFEQEVLDPEGAVEWCDHIVDILLYGVCEVNSDAQKPPAVRGRPFDESIFDETGRDERGSRS